MNLGLLCTQSKCITTVLHAVFLIMLTPGYSISEALNGNFVSANNASGWREKHRLENATNKRGNCLLIKRKELWKTLVAAANSFKGHFPLFRFLEFSISFQVLLLFLYYLQGFHPEILSFNRAEQSNLCQLYGRLLLSFSRWSRRLSYRHQDSKTMEKSKKAVASWLRPSIK